MQSPASRPETLAEAPAAEHAIAVRLVEDRDLTAAHGANRLRETDARASRARCIGRVELDACFCAFMAIADANARIDGKRHAGREDDVVERRIARCEAFTFAEMDGA